MCLQGSRADRYWHSGGKSSTRQYFSCHAPCGTAPLSGCSAIMRHVMTQAPHIIHSLGVLNQTFRSLCPCRARSNWRFVIANGLIKLRELFQASSKMRAILTGVACFMHAALLREMGVLSTASALLLRLRAPQHGRLAGDGCKRRAADGHVGSPKLRLAWASHDAMNSCNIMA